MALKTEIYSLINDAERLCSSCQDAQKLREILTELRESLGRPLRVAVVGIMKAGKSTFMNALMGADILATGVEETTYTVCWFRYGRAPSLVIRFNDGTEETAGFEELRKWSVRTCEKQNPRIREVKYIAIYYPSNVLRQIEFIDTPGLNSSYGTDSQNTLDFLSIKSSKDTLFEASSADAVIYAYTRSAASFDREILERIYAGSGQNTSPINSIGILTKVDAMGIWDVGQEESPVEIAKAIADSDMQKGGMKTLLYSVLPVCAIVLEGFSKLERQDWEGLYKIARAKEEDLREYLADAAEFADSRDEIYEELCSAAQRGRLMELLGQYGIWEICRLLQKGILDQENIKRELDKACGMEAVETLLEKHFGGRTFLIKAQSVLHKLRASLLQIRKSERRDSQLFYICGQINDAVDDLVSSAQSFQELKVLQMYYNGELTFQNDEERDEFLQITGEHGRNVETRLGVAPGSTVAEMIAAAKNKIAFWKDREGDFMMSDAYIRAASVIVRSYERIYYHLNALEED